MRVTQSGGGDLAEWMGKAMVVGFLLWLGLTVLYVGMRQNKVVYRGVVSKDEPVLVEEFEVKSLEPIGTMELSVGAPGLNNQWVVTHVALINPKTEEASHLYLPLEYWSGSGWSEGKRKDSKVFSAVRNGKYVLEIHAQVDDKDPKKAYPGTVNVKLTRDVILWRYPVCTFFLVFLVPMLVIMTGGSGSGGGGGGGGMVAAGGGGCDDGGCGSCSA